MSDSASRAEASLHTGEDTALGVWTLLHSGTGGGASWTAGIVHQPIVTLQSCRERRKRRLHYVSKQKQ